MTTKGSSPNFYTRTKLAFGFLKNLLFAKEISFDNIDIKGSKEFRERISSALAILKERIPEIYNILNKHFLAIVEGPKSMLTLKEDGSLLCLGRTHLSTSETWLAGLLAYHGARCGLFLEKVRQYGSSRKIPREEYSGWKVLDTQYEYLQRLGADYEELKKLADIIEAQT